MPRLNPLARREVQQGVRRETGTEGIWSQSKGGWRDSQGGGRVCGLGRGRRRSLFVNFVGGERE